MWRNLTPLASRVVHGVTGHLSICMWNLRAFPTMQEGVRPLRFVPSSTGLPSKRCPSIGFLSRADREIGVFRRVAPPTTLCLEFTRETGLILRCAGNVGNPFQTKQGNRPSCLEQEGRRCSDEVVREPRCSCRVRPACPGTFGVASRVQSTVSHFKTERGSFLETP